MDKNENNKLQKRFRKISKIGLKNIEYKGNYKIRKYENRLAICRLDGKEMVWDELQRIKNKILGRDKIAIEIYPKETEVINLKNTRHLWFNEAISKIVKKQCRHPEFDKILQEK